MKFHNKKLKQIFTKGLAIVLSVGIFCSMLPAIPAKAAASYVPITEMMNWDYYTYMIDSGYPEGKHNKPKNRIVLLSEFLHSQNSSIKAIPSDKRDDFETSEVVWNPTQKKVDDNRDLYFLQWINGDGYENPGSGYEIQGRIVYITTSGEVRYSKQIDLDDYPRDFLDLGYKEQWDPKRINQCTFAMPDDCAQIVGIYMGNYSDSGNDDNTWWMDNFYIYRITSDKVSDISESSKNNQNHNQRYFSNGTLVAFASEHDISARYLDTNDKAEEWLYLLQTPEQNSPSVSAGSNYYAQIITGETDFSGKELKLDITYTDITGKQRTYTRTVNDSAVEAFYPALTYPEKFYPERKKDTPVLLQDFRNIVGQPHSISSFSINLYNLESHTSYSNYVAMEIPKTNSTGNATDVARQLASYGTFYDYNWETSDTTLTNLYAFTLFGNYADYHKMQEDILGPYTATDIMLDISHHIKEITEIKLSLGQETGSGILQDVRIYASSPENFTRTRMNGGISTERVFYDVSDALCLASVDQSKPIQLSGDGVITCCLNPEEGNLRQYQLLQHNGVRMTLMDEDDNLGVQISLADIYNAGFEIFMSYLNDKYAYSKEGIGNFLHTDPFHTTGEVRAGLLNSLPNHTGLLDETSALEIFNLMESYYKESLTLRIRYTDDFGAVRDVEVPFITSYLLQVYSDNNNRLGTSQDTLFTGILQQGDDACLRIPLSQYNELVDITLSFGNTPNGITNLKNNKYWYYNDPAVTYITTNMFGSKLQGSWEEMWSYLSYAMGNDVNFLSREQMKAKLGETESVEGGKNIPASETFSIRAIRLYEHVTRKEFSTVYDTSKRVTRLSTSRDCDYYYAAKDKKGTIFAIGSKLTLSVSDGTLKKGSVDYSKSDLKNMYLVELDTISLFDEGHSTAHDLYVTVTYTTTSGEEKNITSRRLSDLAKDFFGGNNMRGLNTTQTGFENQTMEALKAGYAYFLLELEEVSRFESIHLSVPDGETRGIQINSISVYDLDSLSQRYSSPRNCTYTPLFIRDFTGEKVAFNNKPAALQPNREGFTFYFTKINTDGTYEDPSTNTSYKDEYLLTPPTTMTYEETLRDLGLAVTKYTYTVDIHVANVLDAGSSNYFYFQLVFENGTSGVVLANQQLASDSFRQGYTESFTIHTTQNYGNVTAVRVICDTTSSSSQVFDKLNIDSITVSLPSKGGAKSWIIDKVGWIDINYQDEGVSATISEEKQNVGFPNSQVVKEFARTRTASTARLLFNLSTAADSPALSPIAGTSDYEASLVYEDTAGYTQTYNFNLKYAIYNFIENENMSFLFRPNKSDYFTLSINDIASIKSLNIYRTDGYRDWIIRDVSVSQFSDLGNVYKSTTGEFKRYIEDEQLLTTSTNSNITIPPSGTGVFSFEDNSINIDIAGNDPATWTTTITRLPSTTQESLNVYLYAGSSDNRTYYFTPGNLPGMKGRMEYTFKEGGSTIGSESFAFTDFSTINGTAVLKASGIKVTGMNQLKTLYLETSSADAPIISGARVERIRGNTIVETLYFDFANTALTAGHNYSAMAKADTLSSLTKQTLALQVSGGQEQLFTESSNVAVALLYTSENNSADAAKPLYSSPYVFFTDAGITSIGNTSILEIPFEVSGADQIAGISIASTGPNVKFENAIIYNYVENSNHEKIMVDTCQIAQAFNTSTVSKQLMETGENSNVTPVTFTLTTSEDSMYQGAGTSGRLPLVIHYKTLDDQDTLLVLDNFSALLPANTLPTAGSSVSFKVQLSNFKQLISVNLNAPDDDWHLEKVKAEIGRIVNTTIISQHREAYVDSWITSSVPLTAVFGNGNDSEYIEDEILGFSVTGKTEKSRNTETATSGNVLKIQAIPGEKVTFTPQITSYGSPDETVIWDTGIYANYMLGNSSATSLTLLVPTEYDGFSSVGEVFSFTCYCSSDTEKLITIAVEIVEEVTAAQGGGTSNKENTSADQEDSSEEEEEEEDTDISQEISADVKISVENAGSSTNGPALPSFSAEEGKNQSYTIYVNPGEYIGTWTFAGETDTEDHQVTFSSSTLTIDDTSDKTEQVIMSCKDPESNELFQVKLDIIVKALTLTITPSDTTYSSTQTFSADGSYTYTIPYRETEETYSLQLSSNHENAKAVFSSTGKTLEFSNQKDGVSYEKGSTIKTLNAICAPIEGTGQSFTVSVTIKVEDE